MERKSYKQPVSYVVVIGTDEFLGVYYGATSLQRTTLGVSERQYVGNFVPKGDDDDNLFSKGDSWESE